MVDPRFNSVHLEPTRREQFRQARADLLAARGLETVAAENGAALALADPNTQIQQAAGKQAPPGVKFWLVDKDFIYPLKVGLNSIGRSPDNDVVLADPFVSRRHCAILVHAGGRCELHDVASKNGTWLNGRRIPGPTQLATGDEIRLCDRQLVFVTKDGKDAPPELPYQSPTLAG
ncbi:MAG TPA: FHA domain-containing protein [Gemmataceae bacterium]|nr:FHA domain-containing protein [Gemmataceae bacterium]